mgnify:FL=1
MLNSQQLSEVLRANGYKVTPQRLAVYEALVATKSHPAAEMLFSVLQPNYPSMSFATVYKTVEILHKINVIQILNTGEDSMRYDADTSIHHHIQCISCGRVDDLNDLDSLALVKEAERLSGYEIAGHQFYFFGVCPECKKVLQN